MIIIYDNIRLKPDAERELIGWLFDQQSYLLNYLPTDLIEIENIIFGDDCTIYPKGDQVVEFLNTYYNELPEDLWESLRLRYRDYQHDLKEKYLEYIGYETKE